MTEQELRARVVAAARAWLGRNEADGTHRPIIERYNAICPLPRGYKMTYSDAWCAAFVSAVGAVCGLEDIIYPECACDAMIAAYKAAGRWHGGAYCAEAQAGDLVFYDWGRDGSSDHVGIITDVGTSCYTVIEGNYSDAVKQRTVVRGYEHICGFALPDYASMATGAAQSDEVQTGITGALTASDGQQEVAVSVTREMCTVTLPVLRRGDGIGEPNEAVRAAQELLRLRGFRCGAAGSDGEFGDKTAEAARKFQHDRQLAQDGVIGAETWAALLGLRAQNGSQMKETDGTDCAQF